MLEIITFIMIVIYLVLCAIMASLNVSAMNDEEKRPPSDALKTAFVTWGFSVILFVVMCIIKRIYH